MTHIPSLATTTSNDLHRLQDKIVLVKFARNEPDFPVALRGTLEVRDPELPAQTPIVELILTFPDMFNVPAHQRVIPLSTDDLTKLLASERDGTFEFTIENEIDVARR
jgi:hypothetical protein